jgi:hypothetical protein
MGKWDDEADDEPNDLTKELEQEQELVNHLGSYHVVLILK